VSPAAGEALVRPIRPDDVQAVAGLIRDLAEYERYAHLVTSTTADLHEALFGDRPAVFAHVVECDDSIVGFALWFLNYSTWTGRHGIFLEDLFVLPSMRGKGFGAALMRELASICVARGYPRMDWSVLDWNEPAIGFYRRAGALPQDAWTNWRLSGDALTAFARPGPGPAPS
jgi:GNAT superfamily N-acetyltransferase